MKPIFWIILACLLFWYLVISSILAHSEDIINIEHLTNAIYKAEGGDKTNYPYGILAKFKYTTPRQACINTIKYALRDYTGKPNYRDFIIFLGGRYCPVGAKNDPKGLNKNWIKNVTYFYEK